MDEKSRTGGFDQRFRTVLGPCAKLAPFAGGSLNDESAYPVGGRGDVPRRVR